MIGVINHNRISNNLGMVSGDSLFSDFAGNTGHSLISESVVRNFLDQKPYYSINNLYVSFTTHDIDMLKKCNHIIIILKDFLRADESYSEANVEIFKSNLKIIQNQLDVQMTILSLGLNNHDASINLDSLIELIPSYFKEWLKAIDHKTFKFCTRGYRSAEILDKLNISNILPLGCPSYFYNKFPKIYIDDYNYNDLTIFNGVFCNKRSKNHIYTIQDERILFEMLNGKKYQKSDYAYFYDMSELYADDIMLHKDLDKVKYFFNFSSAKDIYINAKLSIGSRIHGGVASLSCGVPAIITNHDLRATEMCEFLKIPHFPKLGFTEGSDFGESINLIDLLASVSFDKYNQAYEEKYTNFLDFKNNFMDIL